ncbi:hypothetical protein D3C87_1152050 [compost metagenome]
MVVGICKPDVRLGRDTVLPVIWAVRRRLTLRKQALLPDYLPGLRLKQDRSAWLLVPAGISLALSPGCFPCTQRRLVACMPPTAGFTSAWLSCGFGRWTEFSSGPFLIPSRSPIHQSSRHLDYKEAISARATRHGPVVCHSTLGR